MTVIHVPRFTRGRYRYTASLPSSLLSLASLLWLASSVLIVLLFIVVLRTFIVFDGRLMDGGFAYSNACSNIQLVTICDVKEDEGGNTCGNSSSDDDGAFKRLVCHKDRQQLWSDPPLALLVFRGAAALSIDGHEEGDLNDDDENEYEPFFSVGQGRRGKGEEEKEERDTRRDYAFINVASSSFNDEPTSSTSSSAGGRSEEPQRTSIVMDAFSAYTSSKQSEKEATENEGSHVRIERPHCQEETCDDPDLQHHHHSKHYHRNHLHRRQPLHTNRISSEDLDSYTFLKKDASVLALEKDIFDSDEYKRAYLVEHNTNAREQLRVARMRQRILLQPQSQNTQQQQQQQQQIVKIINSGEDTIREEDSNAAPAEVRAVTRKSTRAMSAANARTSSSDSSSLFVPSLSSSSIDRLAKVFGSAVGDTSNSKKRRDEGEEGPAATTTTSATSTDDAVSTTINGGQRNGKGFFAFQEAATATATAGDDVMQKGKDGGTNAEAKNTNTNKGPELGAAAVATCARRLFLDRIYLFSFSSGSGDGPEAVGLDTSAHLAESHRIGRRFDASSSSSSSDASSVQSPYFAFSSSFLSALDSTADSLEALESLKEALDAAATCAIYVSSPTEKEDEEDDEEKNNIILSSPSPIRDGVEEKDEDNNDEGRSFTDDDDDDDDDVVWHVEKQRRPADINSDKKGHHRHKTTPPLSRSSTSAVAEKTTMKNIIAAPSVTTPNEELMKQQAVSNEHHHHHHQQQQFLRKRLESLKARAAVLLEIESLLLASPPPLIDTNDASLVTSPSFVQKYSSQTNYLHLWKPSYHSIDITKIAVNVAISINSLRRQRYQQILSHVAALVKEAQTGMLEAVEEILKIIIMMRNAEAASVGGKGISGLSSSKEEEINALKDTMLRELFQDSENVRGKKDSEKTTVHLPDAISESKDLRNLQEKSGSGSGEPKNTAAEPSRTSLFVSPSDLVFSYFRHKVSEETLRQSLSELVAPSIPSRDWEQETVLRRTMGAMSVDCSIPGICNKGICARGVCICINDAITGHWGGTFCNECDSGWAGPDCLLECNGGYCNPCSGHGTCSYGTAGDGSCVCNADSFYGYWTGEICDQCISGFFGEYCKGTCEGITPQDGLPCSGRGYCSSTPDATSGTCVCDLGWGSPSFCEDCDEAYYGATCSQLCKGTVNVTNATGHVIGLTPCSGHGECSHGVKGNGTCNCEAYYAGPDCAIQCPNRCSGHGKCNDGAFGDGRCVCQPNYAPPSCAYCYPNVTGGECDLKCPEGANGQPCSGNGLCYETVIIPTTSLATTTAFTSTRRSTTTTTTPPTTGSTTSYHGNESASSSSDTSPSSSATTHAPVTTATTRPTTAAQPTTTSTTTTAAPAPSPMRVAMCECADGYGNRPVSDAVCQYGCPRADPLGPPCSGHGSCISQRDPFTNVYAEVCQCYSNSVDGYWEGALCDRCQLRYNQSEGCLLRCPGVSQPCSGHGTCANGRCYCQRELFHYCGEACDTSADFGSICVGSCTDATVYGSNCNQPCPSIVSGPDGTNVACSGHGFCSNGQQGNGRCQCFHGFAGDGCELTCPSSEYGMCGGPTRGQCRATADGATAYCACSSFYSGLVCDVACPTRNGLPCSGRGQCQSDGVCLCNSREWTGAACDVACLCDISHGQCDAEVCQNNLPHEFCGVCKCDTNFTGDCSICASGRQGPTCEGVCGGAAQTGTTSGRSCICQPYYATATCTVACHRDDNNTICGGNGICNDGGEGDGACVCFPLDDPIYFGPVCTTYCTKAHCEAQGFQNVVCNPKTGACECEDNDEGHWVDDPSRTDGQRCTTCKVGYWGPSCTEPCGCNDHGICDPTSGDCTCFSNDKEGYFTGSSCDKCAVGYIGERCDRANVQITRISAERSIVNRHLLEASNLGKGKVNTAFALDEAESLLYVGSPNVVIDVSDVEWYNAQYSTSQTPIFNESFWGGPPTDGRQADNSLGSTSQIFRVYVDDSEVFYLIQPTKTAHVKLRSGRKNVYNVPLVDLFNQSWPTLNLYGMRIIASAFLDKNIVAVVAELDSNGGILRSSVLWKLASAGMGTAADANARDLPKNFVTKDVAITMYPTTSGLAYVVFISGHRLISDVANPSRSLRQWEILAFTYRYKGSITINPAFKTKSSATSEGSIREFVPCWPSEISTPPNDETSGGSGGGSGGQSKYDSCLATYCPCPRCTSINKITPIERSKMIIAVSTAADGSLSNYLAYIDLIENAPMAGEIGPKDETDSLWFLTNLETQTCAAYKHNTLATYEETSGTVVTYQCDARYCIEDTRARFYVKIAQINEPTMAVTSITTDVYATVGYIALYEPATEVSSYLSSTSTSSILKFSISPYDFGVYGTRALSRVQLDSNDVEGTNHSIGMGLSERPTILILDNSSRLLYCVFAGISRFRIGVFLAYEVTEINPSIAGMGANTTIDVWGNGFAELITPTRNPKFPPPPNTTAASSGTTRKPYCVFDDVYIPATYVNRTLLRCRVTEVNETTVSDQCIGGRAEVTLFYPGHMVTNNQLRLRRAPVVVLEYCEPKQGYYRNRTTVRVRGSGFVEQPTCKFYSSDSSNPEVAFSTGFIDTSDPNVIYCTQPAMQNASRGNGLLSISLDKQQYSEPLQYEIVGDASEMRIATDSESSSSSSSSGGGSSSSAGGSSATGAASTSTVNALVNSDIESFFSIAGFVVDAEGHELNALDFPKTYQLFTNVTRETECDPSDPDYTWRTPDDGFPYPRCSAILLNNISSSSDIHNASLGIYENQSAVVDDVLVLTNVSHQGVVQFGKLFLFRPAITTLIVSVRGAPPYDNLFARARIEVIEGDPVALAIANRQTFVDNPLLIPENQPIKPDIVVIVVDVNGNIISDENTIKQHRVTARAVTVDDETHIETEDRLANIPLPISSLTYSKVQLSYIHGMDHFVEFTVEPYLKPVRTPPIRTTRCALTMYKQIRSGNCLPCPSAGAICSGTELILVQPGYWRASNSSDAIYDCESGSEICLGNAATGNGTFCALGYVPASPLCSVCIPGYAKSGADACLACMETKYALAIVVVVFVVVLIAVVIWIIMTLRRAETTDLSVVSRTLLNHFQAAGELGEFSARFDPFLRNVLAIQGSGSSFSLNGLQIAGCLLQAADADYSTTFWIYMASPVLFVFLAIVIFVVVRLAGLVPVITDKLRDEIMEDLKSIGEQASTAILLRKYPFYMVVVTTLCVTLFTMYQTLIAQATKVLQCIKYEVGKDALGLPVYQQYLKEDMSILCDSQGQHSFYIPALVFAIGYGVGIPASFIFGIKYVDGRIGKPELTKLIFLFLTGGYKEEFYFWQAFIMVRKLIIVLVVVLIPDGKMQTYVGMLVFAAALGLQLLLKPAEKEEHNVIEAISLAIVTATLSLSMVYFWPGVENTKWGDAVTIMLLIITFGAILVFVVFLIEPVKDLIIDTLKTAQEIVLDIKAEYIDGINGDNANNDSDEDDAAAGGVGQADDARVFYNGEGYDELIDIRHVKNPQQHQQQHPTGADGGNGSLAASGGKRAGGGGGPAGAGGGISALRGTTATTAARRGIFSSKSAVAEEPILQSSSTHNYQDYDYLSSAATAVGGGGGGGAGGGGLLHEPHFELLDEEAFEGDDDGSPIELPIEWGDEDDVTMTERLAIADSDNIDINPNDMPASASGRRGAAHHSRDGASSRSRPPRRAAVDAYTHIPPDIRIREEESTVYRRGGREGGYQYSRRSGSMLDEEEMRNVGSSPPSRRW